MDDIGGLRLHEHEVVALGEGRLVVRDGLLGRERALEVWLAVTALAPELTPAGVGRSGARRHVDDIRGDRTAWLTQLDPSPPLAGLWQGFEAIRTGLNRDAWLGLARFEVQVACYPGDAARYVRHRDAFRDDDGRRLTAIYYLNPDWRPEHGGMLRAWMPDGVVDVPPLLDRLVLFLSDRLEHAVLPSHAPRYAVTAWFRGAEDIPLLPDPSAVSVTGGGPRGG